MKWETSWRLLALRLTPGYVVIALDAFRTAKKKIGYKEQPAAVI